MYYKTIKKPVSYIIKVKKVTSSLHALTWYTLMMYARKDRNLICTATKSTYTSLLKLTECLGGSNIHVHTNRIMKINTT